MKQIELWTRPKTTFWCQKCGHLSLDKTSVMLRTMKGTITVHCNIAHWRSYMYIAKYKMVLYIKTRILRLINWHQKFSYAVITKEKKIWFTGYDYGV